LLLFKEAMNNSLKYANARNTTLEVALKQQRLEVIFKDDGKGMILNGEIKGYGLKNMQQRAKAIQADFILDSQPEKGTCIKLEMDI